MTYNFRLLIVGPSLSENQTQRTGFELFCGTFWELNPELLLLLLHYVVCASSIKTLPSIYGCLNLLYDTLD